MTTQTVELTAKDLNHAGGVYCPNPLAKMAVVNTHPRCILTWRTTAKPSAPIAAPSISSRPASTSTRTERASGQACARLTASRCLVL